MGNLRGTYCSGKYLSPLQHKSHSCWERNERQKQNVFEKKYHRSMANMSRLDRLRNEEVRQRIGLRKNMVTRVDRNVLR